MPLDFLKRRGGDEPGGMPLPEEIAAQEHTLKLNYSGRSSEGVRLKAGTDATRELPEMLIDVAIGEVEVVEPLPVELQGARPLIQRTDEASQWLRAHGHRSPIVRHTLVVLESVDAVDLAFDTLAVALLQGDLDTAGYPEYNAIVGGVASHWDEATGDMIVRAVVGWGGRGIRGDTTRAAQTILAGLMRNVLSSSRAIGTVPLDAGMPAIGRGGAVCAHCGFAAGHERAFYCPKCGMRLARG